LAKGLQPSLNKHKTRKVAHPRMMIWVTKRGEEGGLKNVGPLKPDQNFVENKRGMSCGQAGC